MRLQISFGIVPSISTLPQPAPIWPYSSGSTMLMRFQKSLFSSQRKQWKLLLPTLEFSPTVHTKMPENADDTRLCSKKN